MLFLGNEGGRVSREVLACDGIIAKLWSTPWWCSGPTLRTRVGISGHSNPTEEGRGCSQRGGLYLGEATGLESEAQPSQTPRHEAFSQGQLWATEHTILPSAVHYLGPIMEPSTLTVALLLPFLLALPFPTHRALLPSWCVSSV